MRILYHAINGIGLGHLMRLSAIARAVQVQAAHVHQFIVTSANYPPHLRRLNMPVMILPDDDSGPLVAPDRRSRSVSREFSSRLLNHAIQEYDPRAVVFDTHAPWRLVKKVVDEGREPILVYRRCKEEFILKHLRDGFLSRFHLVLIPHDEAEFQSGLRRSTLRALRNLETVRYVGPVVYPVLTPALQEQVSDRHGLSKRDRLILITAGAGGLGRLNQSFFERAAEAAVQLRAKSASVRVICVGGPYSRPVSVPEGCLYVEDEPNLQALIARSDVVITVPGYNTVQEILYTGARVLIVPAKRKMEDIEARVELLVRRGRARCVGPGASVADYERHIEALLRSPRPVPEPCPGAPNAAEAIIQLVKAPRRYLCSREPLSAIGAVSYPSPRKLVVALRDDQVREAIVRVDWDMLRKLLADLGEGASCVSALEIILGQCDVEEAGRRIRAVREFLDDCGFPSIELVFCVDDPTGGRLLAELTQQVRDVSFRALVARFAKDTFQRNPDEVFASLELCRNFATQFKIDITLLEDQYTFIDQP
jgi:UDP-N-acetylglucosamine--N-acetylmuramyl-(pentapeptide) pyrophosphoryl-undecaprenol N-acetylglucosamine transferase